VPSTDAPAPVPDAAYNAMIDKRVTIDTEAGSSTGKLLSVAEDSVVLIGDDGEVITVRKADATRLRLASKTPDETLPSEEIPTEAPAETPADDGKPVASPADGKPKGDEGKRPPAKHKLGLFTSHGIAYSHFRQSDSRVGPASNFRDGGPSYALDVGVGYNFNDRLGLYGLVGGLVGAPLQDKTVRGHFGHVAVSLAFKGKYIAFVPGLGVGFSALRDSDGVDRRAGFALPIKVMGIIPLPKELFLGIGIGYDLGILRGSQIFNGISGQLTVGRW
jgi:hypothetical protein